MGFFIDVHSHTSRYSECSRISPEDIVPEAIRAGLDGLVITEHHYQWTPEELQTLLDEAEITGFLLLAGFEYSSAMGDILVYGLDPDCATVHKPCGDPERFVDWAKERGGACIAAHPTRAGLGFDERLQNMAVDAIEVCSVNLEIHERRLARRLAEDLEIPALAASDAHDPFSVGRYCSEFEGVICTGEDLWDALKRGRFRPVESRVLPMDRAAGE
jgi:predicted metal-dependent phosphoesterase TrpH